MRNQNAYRYFLMYKPYGVHCQFRPGEGQRGLGDVYDFPKDVYPVGRLDADSEGLLVLTNDPEINALLLDPDRGHERIYQVQVEGLVTDEAIKRLRQGVSIRIDGKDYRTRPAQASRIGTPSLPDREPPIRYRKTVPDSWLELRLTEGKNRQVRRMTATVGFPTLRLVRVMIGRLSMHEPFAGKVIELNRKEVNDGLFKS
jgi:23S rRNA pseudouridine2457 synthase